MTLTEIIDQTRDELAPYQEQLTPGELFRATAVFDRAVEVRVNINGDVAGEKVVGDEEMPTIYRIDNQANSVQTPLTILFQSREGRYEDPRTEVILLGVVRTDQLERASVGLTQRGYQFK